MWTFTQVMDGVSRGVEVEGMVPWRRWRLMAPGAPPPERRNDTG